MVYKYVDFFTVIRSLVPYISYFLAFYICYKECLKRNVFYIVGSLVLLDVIHFVLYFLLPVSAMSTFIFMLVDIGLYFVFIQLIFKNKSIDNLVLFLILTFTYYTISLGLHSIDLAMHTLPQYHSVINNVLPVIRIISYIVLGLGLHNSIMYMKGKIRTTIAILLGIITLLEMVLLELLTVFPISTANYYLGYLGILFCIVSISFMIVVVIVVFKEKEKMKDGFVENVISASQRQIEEVQRYNDAMKELRHDYKNNMIVLNSLYESGKMEEFKKYLDAMSDPILHKEDVIITDNVYVDGLLNFKRNNYPDITFDYEYSREGKSNVDEIEMCTLISNVLENAIHEVQVDSIQDKMIRLRMIEKEGTFLIYIENPLSKIKSLDSDSEDIYHGLGLQIVKRIVDKNNGVMEITQGDTFKVSILLNK